MAMFSAGTPRSAGPRSPLDWRDACALVGVLLTLASIVLQVLNVHR